MPGKKGCGSRFRQRGLLVLDAQAGEPAAGGFGLVGFRRGIVRGGMYFFLLEDPQFLVEVGAFPREACTFE